MSNQQVIVLLGQASSNDIPTESKTTTTATDRVRVPVRVRHRCAGRERSLPEAVSLQQAGVAGLDVGRHGQGIGHALVGLCREGGNKGLRLASVTPPLTSICPQLLEAPTTHRPPLPKLDGVSILAGPFSEAEWRGKVNGTWMPDKVQMVELGRR